MSAQHTSGRLKVQHPHAGKRGWEIAFEPGLEQVCQNVTKANAHRLVACWNALEMLSTGKIEAVTQNGGFPGAVGELIEQRDELLEALKEVVGYWDSIVPTDCVNDMHIKARAAIEKATVGES